MQWETSQDFDDTAALIERACACIFAGVAPGNEVRERAPVHVELGSDREALVPDATMANGWRFQNASASGSIGQHAELAGYLAGWMACRAEEAWAVNAHLERPARLGPDFSFDAFLDGDATVLCARLRQQLEKRMAEHPDPRSALSSSVEELKRLGHDLWSWADDAWGHDYMTSRPGAGLYIDPNVDERDERALVLVTFAPRDVARRQ